MLLRQMAVAFIFNDKQEVLFLQKNSGSRFLPGQLVPIGGHMEDGEINDPQRACLREIEEETGLQQHSLADLALRYIVHRVKEDKEVRIQYIFTAKAAAESRLVESEEGQLIWVDCRTISNHQVTASTKEVMRHYLETGIHNDKIHVGSMHAVQEKPAIRWAVLEDWESV